MAGHKKNSASDIWQRVDRRGDDECWPWLGALKHPHFKIPAKVRWDGSGYYYPPRLVAFLTSGAWPDRARRYQRSCLTTACVNPRHVRSGGPSNQISIAERIVLSVRHDAGCHVWTGRFSTTGGARITIGGAGVQVSHWLWCQRFGYMPGRLERACGNDRCVSPDHHTERKVQTPAVILSMVRRTDGDHWYWDLGDHISLSGDVCNSRPAAVMIARLTGSTYGDMSVCGDAVCINPKHRAMSDFKLRSAALGICMWWLGMASIMRLCQALAAMANGAARLMRRVTIDAVGCWVWSGSVDSQGYPKLYGQVAMHRTFYRIHNGPIPRGLLVRHQCDNKRCVSPRHLELGTHADNMADMAQRGRANNGGGAAHLVEPLRQEIRRLRAMGMGYRRIAKSVGCCVSTVRNAIKRGTVRRIGKQQWSRILLRYGGACALCGSRDDLQRDHIVPVSHGGDDAESNIRPLCGPCNRGRSSNSAKGLDIIFQLNQVLMATPFEQPLR